MSQAVRRLRDSNPGGPVRPNRITFFAPPGTSSTSSRCSRLIVQRAGGAELVAAVGQQPQRDRPVVTAGPGAATGCATPRQRPSARRWRRSCGPARWRTPAPAPTASPARPPPCSPSATSRCAKPLMLITVVVLAVLLVRLRRLRRRRRIGRLQRVVLAGVARPAWGVLARAVGADERLRTVLANVGDEPGR